MQTAHEIDYESLAQAYVEALNDTLRLFSPGPAFLKTWVYDSDTTRSLAGIAECAADAALQSVTVRIAPATFASVDEVELRRMTADFAHLDITRGASSVTIAMRVGADEAAKAKPRSVAPVAHAGGPVRQIRQEARASVPKTLDASYQAGVARVLERIDHEGALQAQAGELVIEVSEGAVTVSVAVDPSSHTVSSVRHKGAVGDEPRALVELLCRVMEGRPVQENADHAALRVEHQLRPKGTRPVAGVVMPENVSQAFQLPLALARKIRAEYASRAGFGETRNFFDAAPRALWAQASEQTRLTRLSDATAAWCATVGLPEEAVYPIHVVDDYRVVFEVYDGPERKRAQMLLIALEAMLQEQIEPSIELCLEEMKDRNKLRKLEIRTKRK